MNALMAAAWGAVALALAGWMLPLEPSLLEEGYLIHFAQRMIDGEHLYRDLITYTGPLPFELLAALFRIFGEEIAVGRWAVGVLHGLAAAASFDLARRAGVGTFAHLAAACVAAAPVFGFPLMSVFFYSTLAYGLSVLAAWSALLGTTSIRFAVLAGLLVSAVALCKQTTGLVLALGLLPALLLATPSERRLRHGAAMVAGGGGLALVTLAFYAVRGELGSLTHALVVLPLSLEASFDSAFPNLWPLGRLAPAIADGAWMYLPAIQQHLVGPTAATGPIALSIQLLYVLPLLALVLTALRAVLAPLSAAAWIHAVVVAAGTSGLFPRTDWGHLVYVLPPTLVQLCLLLPGRPRWASVPAGCAAAAVLAAAVAGGNGLHGLALDVDLGPRVPQRAVSQTYQREQGLTAVIDYLRGHTELGDPIFVPRMEPLIYFATDTRNPTPFGGVIPGIRDEQERAILPALEQVRFVAMSDVDRPLFNYYRDELPGVQRYFERYFRVAAPFARASSLTIVLERGEDRGATAIDLLDQPVARRWLRDGQGAVRDSSELPPVLPTRKNRRPLALYIGPGGGGVDFELRIPAGAVFQADTGLAVLTSTDRLQMHATPAVMEVQLADPARDPLEFETLASARVDLRVQHGQSWQPLEADLSRFAGRRVVLRLDTRPVSRMSRPELVWWGSPRIALRP